MAIQSASALNAYLTADSSASIGAAIPDALRAGTPAPTSAGAQKAGAGDREPDQEQAPDDGGASSLETPLAPIYGSNARSVGAAIRPASISLFA